MFVYKIFKAALIWHCLFNHDTFPNFEIKIPLWKKKFNFLPNKKLLSNN